MLVEAVEAKGKQLEDVSFEEASVLAEGRFNGFAYGRLI